MLGLDAHIDPHLPVMPLTGQGGRLFGVYTATVTDVQDPEGQGRVRIRLPWATDPDGFPYDTWARLATLMAGARRGTWFIPEEDDEVLVSFVAGDPRRPVVVGALWNGVDQPPEAIDAANNIRSITSRSGIRITLDDTAGAVRLTLETPGGQVVTLNDAPASIELRDASGNTVKLESAGITLTTSTKLSIQATTVDISASSMNANVGVMTVSGPLNAGTCVNTPSVIAASYTPGAGNIL
jgi:uncharacterized protein involved in type VI secretion and phage assembly